MLPIAALGVFMELRAWATKLTKPHHLTPKDKWHSPSAGQTPPEQAHMDDR